MMDTANCKYVASCAFTRENPELSVKVQDYLQQRFAMPAMRCCMSDYTDFTDAMPEWLRSRWRETPNYLNFAAGDIMVYVCHNCAAIFEETLPGVKRISLWELILSDGEFLFPDYAHEKMTLQDCWRSYDNAPEQEAVRRLLQKMNVDFTELEENRENTQFCGITLYTPASKRALELAPNRFATRAEGKFIPHTPEQQKALMQKHCEKIMTDKVVVYCHYCTKGIALGGKQPRHLASLLFDFPS